MLTQKDWNSLRFAGSRLAAVTEWTLGFGAVIFFAMACAYLGIATRVAAKTKMSLWDLWRQWLPRIRPNETYLGTSILALEPLVLSLVCFAMAVIVGAFGLMFAVTRRRNRRFLEFLDKFQESFQGTIAPRFCESDVMPKPQRIREKRNLAGKN